MMDNIHNFQEMMEMVQTMQELFPEASPISPAWIRLCCPVFFSTAKSDTGGQKNGLFQDTPLDAG